MSIMILLGGRSSRLGQDKTQLVIDGQRLLDQIIDQLSQLDQEIILVLAPGQSPPQLDTSHHVKIVTDPIEGKGPLIGLYAGLKAATDAQCLALACDMPFLNLELIRYMMSVSAESDITIPRIIDLVEPMHAIYARTCLPHMKQLIRKRWFKPLELLEMVNVKYVEKEEVERFDPQHLSFFNINTQADYRKAKDILSKQGGQK